MNHRATFGWLKPDVEGKCKIAGGVMPGVGADRVVWQFGLL